jgi:hypothetical protein
MIEKPKQHTHYDYHALFEWLKEARPGAAIYLRESFEGGNNGFLGGLDIEQNLDDMREHQKTYAGCRYTTEDLEWLRAEIGDRPAIHYWW